MGEMDLYPMRYDAVLKYADEACPSDSSFRLPEQLLPNPANGTATPPRSAESESDRNPHEYDCTKPETELF